MSRWPEVVRVLRLAQLCSRATRVGPVVGETAPLLPLPLRSVRPVSVLFASLSSLAPRGRGLATSTHAVSRVSSSAVSLSLARDVDSDRAVSGIHQMSRRALRARATNLSGRSVTRPAAGAAVAAGNSTRYSAAQCAEPSDPPPSPSQSAQSDAEGLSNYSPPSTVASSSSSGNSGSSNVAAPGTCLTVSSSVPESASSSSSSTAWSNSVSSRAPQEPHVVPGLNLVYGSWNDPFVIIDKPYGTHTHTHNTHTHAHTHTYKHVI